MDEPTGKVVILEPDSRFGFHSGRIGRRVLELNIKPEFKPLTTKAEEIKAAEYQAIIVSGDPGFACDLPSSFDKDVLKLGLPVLGICYGTDIMLKCIDNDFVKKRGHKGGLYDAEVELDCPLFKGLEKTNKIFLAGGDGLEKIPEGFEAIARHGERIIAVANPAEKLYGLDFLPKCEEGRDVIKNFLLDIAAITPDYTLASRREACVERIKAVVGSKKVVMLVSGGVDSIVAATLMKKALDKDQVVPVFMDTGFLRKFEQKEVMATFSSVGLEVKIIDATNKFSYATTTLPEKEDQADRRRLTKPLYEVTEPEEKRQIMGDMFIEVASEFMKDEDLKPGETLLGLGTTLRVPSAMAHSLGDVSKTRHEDCQSMVEWRKTGRVIEPLKGFLKEEVRELGKDLGLPPEVCNQHPFPGPGLAIRIICARESFVGKDFAETQVLVKVVCGYAKAKETEHALTHRVDTVTTEEERDLLMKYTTESYTATLLPLHVLGVRDGKKSYGYCATLSTSEETVNWEAVFFFAEIIAKVCLNVNRVTFAFGKPIKFPVNEVTPTLLSDLVLRLARQSDYVTHEVLKNRGAYEKITQMPVLVIPVHFDRDPVDSFRIPPGGRSIVLRPFISNDLASGRAALPNKDIPVEVVDEMVAAVRKIPGVSRILYDVTSKPPGTIEWE